MAGKNITINCVTAAIGEEGWHSIDWSKCYRYVRTLQTRIAKATGNQQWRKVKKLQRLLIHSFSARALAVKRVTENSGRKTPGVDGKIWNTPKAKWEAIPRLKRQGYKPLPLKRVNIPKPNGKTRPLGIPTMQDRAMQALYLLGLEPVSETTADHNSYGFRPARSAADAIQQVCNMYSSRYAATWVLEGDIKGCFDHINHEWLLNNVPMDKRILRKWLKAEVIDKGTFRKTISGTPQGGIISPVLANMALDGLENELQTHFEKKRSKKGWKNLVHLVRYADDFIISGKSRELLENEVLPVVKTFLSKRGLMLSEDKTVITHITDGFDFLGQHVRRFGRKLVIRPAKKNVKAFLRKVRNIIEDNKTVPSWLLVYLLNPLIRGWANYHRHVASSDAFNVTDHHIWRKTWQWCARRHPGKSRRWIFRKYHTSIKMRHGMFYGIDDDGKKYVLHRAGSTNIFRHIKIKGAANPYLPEWENYFEKRLDYSWKESQQGQRKILAIWKRQGTQCPHCGQPISRETGWNIHHVLRKSQGGDDGLDNLILLHPNCHRQLHSNEAGF
ncbi:group II intron reverse transcriptase/maturase [Klebsiella variicola]|uniref:group II intron reverse transcriptase/maturase n=1 Tax=Klebsiella variicola TaxID=244366 RepID=UPI003D9FF5EF